MKRWAIVLFGSVVLSVVLSSFDILLLNYQTVSILYTVTGVLFSVEMSMLCSISTESVKDPNIKKEIRKGLDVVRNGFIALFLILTVSFLFCNPGSSLSVSFSKVSIDLNSVTGFICIGGIVYYLLNFFSLQSFAQRIEDAVN